MMHYQLDVTVIPADLLLIKHKLCLPLPMLRCSS